MVFFKKDYWYQSPKGYFRVRIIDGDVLMESTPNNFISTRDLWVTRPEAQQTRDKAKREMIRLKHLDEYALMLNKMGSFNTEEEQDNYILWEMKSKGYTRAR